MRTACPACSVEYEIPDSLIGPGPQMLRCARCRHEWLVTTEEPDREPEPAPEEPPAPGPHAPGLHASGLHAPAERLVPMSTVHAPPLPPLHDGGDIPAAPPAPFEDDLPPRGSGVPTVLGWTATLLVLAFLGWAAVSWRHDIMTIWPPAQRVYGVLGLS